jgi:hypothetical protein
MSSSPFGRRRVLQAAGVTAVASAGGSALVAQHPAAAAVVPPARADIGVSAYPFDLGQVRLTAGRLFDDQTRTLNYLRHVDADRLLYNFRANHRLSTSCSAARRPGGGQRRSRSRTTAPADTRWRLTRMGG